MEAVDDAGFKARLLRDGGDRTRARLRVEGMLCSACSSKVEAALRAAPGVRQAAVSLVTHKAEVRGASVLDPHRLVDSLQFSTLAYEQQSATSIASQRRSQHDHPAPSHGRHSNTILATSGHSSNSLYQVRSFLVYLFCRGITLPIAQVCWLSFTAASLCRHVN